MATIDEHILVIEDNQDIRENIAELLELAGYKVSEAENGKVGARMAIDTLPNLILCDIMMPELDGYGVLNVLSKHRQTQGIPLVFLTAKAEKTDIRKGMSLGADDYITKPFDETDLLTTIENRILKSSSTPVLTNKDFSIDSLFEDKRTKQYKEADYIYTEGDSPVYVYYLKSGKVKLSKMNELGKEVILELCKEGDFFGYWSVLQEGNQMETAQCIADCEVWQIPVSQFSKSLKQSTSMSGQFLKLLSKNLLIKENQILELAYESVRKRVANSLIALCDIYGDNQQLTMKLPRDLIASMAGTSIETAIRMLSEFKKDKLIAIDGSDIQILDYSKLKNAPY